MSITKSEYCADPSKANQAKLGNPNIISYFNSICDAEKAVKNSVDTNSLAKAVPKALAQFAIGLVEQLPLLGMIYGISIPAKLGYEIAMNTLERGMSKLTMEGTKLLIQEGVEMSATNIAAFLATFTTEFTLSVFGVASWGAWGLMKAASFLVDLAGSIWVMAPMLILQITGMIFDSWDPCHLNTQLDAKYVQQLGTQFNEGFRKTLMSAVGAMQTSYGQIYYVDVWPVEYYAEKALLPLFKQEEYDKLLTLYMGRYLNALQHNSNGEPITWPSGEGTALTNEHLSRAARALDNLSLAAADQNTVVASWISRYWPILVLILILIIVFVIVIK